MRKHRQGSNFPKIPKILASMGSARAIVAQILGILGKLDPCWCFRISGFKNFGEIWSLPMFSRPRQARISPKFLKPEMRKRRQGSNFPKILKILASMGSARAIVAQILGILGKFDPCRCFRISGFKKFGAIWSLPMFSHPRLPTSHDPLLRKSSFVWIMGGGGVSIEIYRRWGNIIWLMRICLDFENIIYDWID